MSWKLGISVAVLVIGALAGGTLLFHRTYYQHLLERARGSAKRETQLIRQALEYQMLREDRALLREMVAGFADRASVHRVMIVDRKGVVRFSSDRSQLQRPISAQSKTCLVCHQRAPEERLHDAVIEVGKGEFLRSVQPIENKPQCHGCHGSKHRINGVIIVDVPLKEMQEQMAGPIRKLVVGTAAVTLVLLAGLGWTVRRLILRRLFRFESAARAIADGDLKRRVGVEGNDALTRVEQQFNAMADSVVGLLEKLQEQQANLEKVMNSVDDGMVVLDRHRRIVAANDAFTRRFPLAPGNLLGRSCCRNDEVLGGRLCGCRGECPTLKCFASGAVQTALRTRKMADGSERIEEVRSSPVMAEEGPTSFVVEVWRDITERRTEEARMADYQRMISLGMLASGFSHEINTPLASISTCLDGITRTLGAAEASADIAAVKEYAQIAATQVARCGSVTQQFLRLARGQSLQREILDLPSAVAVVARLCEPESLAREVTVEVEEGADIPAVHANGAAVQQVFLNLVHNAIAFSDAGRVVNVAFEAGNGRGGVRATVSDCGHGMSLEEVQRVFEPFYTRRAGGSGLGLFVSLNLARGWNGDIEVVSELGKGTTFTVSFPPVEG